MSCCLPPPSPLTRSVRSPSPLIDKRRRRDQRQADRRRVDGRRRRVQRVAAPALLPVPGGRPRRGEACPDDPGGAAAVIGVAGLARPVMAGWNKQSSRADGIRMHRNGGGGTLFNVRRTSGRDQSMRTAVCVVAHIHTTYNKGTNLQWQVSVESGVVVTHPGRSRHYVRSNHRVSGIGWGMLRASRGWP